MNKADVVRRWGQLEGWTRVTVAQAADKSGIRLETLRSKCRGETEFKASDLQALLRVWPRLNLHWFLTGEGVPFFEAKAPGLYYREGIPVENFK